MPKVLKNEARIFRTVKFQYGNAKIVQMEDIKFGTDCD